MQKRLDIISLGPGRIDQITPEAKEALLKSDKIYCRFINPSLQYFIKKYKKVVVSFQRFYGNSILVTKLRKKLYIKIAELVVNEALTNKRVSFVLPGSALIAEDTPYLIYKQAKTKGLKVNTILGISFVDVLLNSLPQKYKQHAVIHFAVIPPWRLKTTIFDKNCSYVIFQVDELFDYYKPGEVRNMFLKYYPGGFTFLYFYNEHQPKAVDYRIKMVEFCVSDIANMRKNFEILSGSVFIPAKLIDYDRSYKEASLALKKYRNFDPSFLADLKYEESLAFLKLGQYEKALASAKKALRHCTMRDIHAIMALCLLKLGRFDEAALEIKKAEKENSLFPESRQILETISKKLTIG